MLITLLSYTHFYWELKHLLFTCQYVGPFIKRHSMLDFSLNHKQKVKAITLFIQKNNITFILQQQNENDFSPKDYQIKHVPLILNPDECTEKFLFQTPQILMFLYISIRLINFYISIPYGIQCLSFFFF